MTAIGGGRVPVIVGVGEIADRTGDPALALDPAGLMVHALERAERDAGVPLLGALSRLDIINEVSWPYPDPCSVVLDRLGPGAIDARYHPVGGQTPLLALHEAALAVQDGACEVAAICGGEAEATVRHARRDGIALPWPPAIPDFRPVRGGDFQAPVARRLGLDTPVHVYPLYENATRAAWGQGLCDAQDESARIWAANAAIARGRDSAWLRREIASDGILDPAGGNRLIAWPYRKLMVANPIVNQGAAMIVTSLGRARALGIDERRLIYVHGGAAADEPRDILLREDYRRSRAMEAVLGDAAALAGRGFDAVELYSCFPCVPKMARRVLGLDADTPLSVAGGLTFFGAPLNNYMSHATVAMVERLRTGGGVGLLYGQGEYVTKHHALVLGTAPPGRAPDAAYRRSSATATPPLALDYVGDAAIETSTVLFDRDERVRHGVAICRTPGGERVAARVRAADAASIAVLLGDEPVVGRWGRVSGGAEEGPVWRIAAA